ncbi:PaaX family transcriptional regulator C-terminal domain-containing protein [Paracoccus cavernae]|uniref:PaaX family transcriptional regulator C-terminal domain-containing protein n=1 Tax=Paracoccus cavernae TaxID=1571207 RepID=UPI00363CAF59
MLIAPDHGQTPPEVALTLHAGLGRDDAKLAACWDLAPLNAGYADLIGRFAPLEQALGSGAPLAPDAALIARLLLVDLYRSTLLRDPRLPASALPADWCGHEAHALFARLYLLLSEPAELHIARNLEGETGYLPRTSAISEARLAALA